MKIFLHSDQVKFNNPVDKKIFEILNPKQIKIGYIPSSTDRDRKHYESRKEWYMKYGVKNFLYFDLGEEYNETQLEEFSKCELIHLSGGDTLKDYDALLDKWNYVEGAFMLYKENIYMDMLNNCQVN